MPARRPFLVDLARARVEVGTAPSHAFNDAPGVADEDVGVVDMILDIVQDARRAVAQSVQLPPGTRLEWAGQYRYLERAKARLAIVVPITLLIIFLLLFWNSRSAIEALSSLNRPCRVVFVSDSQYLIRGMREWIRSWKRQNWKRKTGAIENLELWKQLDQAAARHDITWDWVRGHAGHPKNEYANHLATRAARTLDASGGLVSSGFPEWLAEQREKRGRYLDYDESLPPKE